MDQLTTGNPRWQEFIDRLERLALSILLRHLGSRDLTRAELSAR
jgi:hypothetical protein